MHKLAVLGVTVATLLVSPAWAVTDGDSKSDFSLEAFICYWNNLEDVLYNGMCHFDKPVLEDEIEHTAVSCTVMVKTSDTGREERAYSMDLQKRLSSKDSTQLEVTAPITQSTVGFSPNPKCALNLWKPIKPEQ